MGFLSNNKLSISREVAEADQAQAEQMSEMLVSTWANKFAQWVQQTLTFQAARDQDAVDRREMKQPPLPKSCFKVTVSALLCAAEYGYITLTDKFYTVMKEHANDEVSTYDPTEMRDKQREFILRHRECAAWEHYSALLGILSKSDETDLADELSSMVPLGDKPDPFLTESDTYQPR